MRHLFFLAAFAVVLVGCGGDNNKAPPVSTSSSSVAVISSVSSSTRSSSSNSSATISLPVSSSSSSLSSKSSVPASSSSFSSQASSTVSAIPFTLTSTSFVSGQGIPSKYSCDGGETSPQLAWDITSTDIKSFVLIVEDYDAIALVGHPYVHWNVYNIPADVRQIAEGATMRFMPIGSNEGKNDDGYYHYSGPCPPKGTGTHHYFFTLYALNQENLVVNTSKSMERGNFETQYASAIIQKAEISGHYTYK